MLPNEEQFSTHFLPENLRALRKRAGLSQEELASKVGLNRGNIASYEKGTAVPKLCNLIKLAGFFKVPVIELTSGSLLHSPLTQNGQLSGSKDSCVHQINRELAELRKVVDSLETCYYFNIKNLCEEERNSKEIQALITHFEQLREVTRSLLHTNSELLGIARKGSGSAVT
jgi:transcriptional regulator with XRE-family HTH domain